VANKILEYLQYDSFPHMNFRLYLSFVKLHYLVLGRRSAVATMKYASIVVEANFGKLRLQLLIKLSFYAFLRGSNC
jgi:hypothetical protein